MHLLKSVHSLHADQPITVLAPRVCVSRSNEYHVPDSSLPPPPPLLPFCLPFHIHTRPLFSINDSIKDEQPWTPYSYSHVDMSGRTVRKLHKWKHKMAHFTAPARHSHTVCKNPY